MTAIEQFENPLVPSRKVPFFRVACDGNELDYIAKVLASGWLTSAKRTQEFERKFAAIVHAKHSFAVNSCTAALHLALEAIGVGPGWQVFVPTMTFTATAGAVDYLGAEPILLDVEYGSGLLTPDILKKAIADNPNVKSLVIVHHAGQPAAMLAEDGEGILDIYRANGISVVEDAAHAFPASLYGRMVGSLGDVTCFSFYPNKPITTAEGGIVATNDDTIAERVAIMRNHGIDRDAWQRSSEPGPKWQYDVVAPGFKYNMSDVHAAIGLAQLERVDEFWECRHLCVKRYLKMLAKINCLDMPICHVPGECHAWHLFFIMLKDNAPVDRNTLIQLLHARGIETSVHYRPLHRMSYYINRFSPDEHLFPGADRMWKTCLSLPLFSTMTIEEVDYVCANLKDILM